MVRVLLIRHAQSMQNEFMEGVSARIAAGELEPSELNATMRNAPALHDAGADSPLTELGEQQAELLGERWAPLLEEKARQGKLRVFCSPFLRTLQTAEPLMRRLHAAVPECKATLLPAIMERGALAAPEDMRKFDEIDRLKLRGAKLKEFMKSIEWQPMGMSVNEMRRRFRWAESAKPDDASLPTFRTPAGEFALPPDDRPWWEAGYESGKFADARTSAVCRWLDEQSREDLPGDTVIVCVCHGGTIASVTNVLLGAAVLSEAAYEEVDDISLDGIRNSSVTSLLLPSAAAIERMPTHGGSAGSGRFRTKLELFNDTCHLGMALLTRFAEDNLSARL